jgi:hypothetical protein
MCSKNSRLSLWVLFTLGLNVCSAQSFRIKGGETARPGFMTTLQLEVVRGDIAGPVRFAMPLPTNWKASIPFENYGASLLSARDEVQLVWLDFPLVDTLRCTIALQVPDDQVLQPVVIAGSLSYFDTMGAQKKLPSSSHSFKVMRYFSRYQ